MADTAAWLVHPVVSVVLLPGAVAFILAAAVSTLSASNAAVLRYQGFTVLIAVMLACVLILDANLFAWPRSALQKLPWLSLSVIVLFALAGHGNRLTLLALASVALIVGTIWLAWPQVMAGTLQVESIYWLAGGIIICLAFALSVCKVAVHRFFIRCMLFAAGGVALAVTAERWGSIVLASLSVAVAAALAGFVSWQLITRWRNKTTVGFANGPAVGVVVWLGLLAATLILLTPVGTGDPDRGADPDDPYYERSS